MGNKPKQIKLLISKDLFPKRFASKGLLTPTPILKNDGQIRVYVGMRDSSGVSRIGWADLSPFDGSVSDVSTTPVMELGIEGAFDSQGMILGDLFMDPYSGDLTMAYVGFNSFPSHKFRAFTGFAISSDGGDSFRRVQIEPSLGPHNLRGNETIVAVHSVYHSIDGWDLLVAIGNDWEMIDGIRFPKYSIFQAKGPSLNELIFSEQPMIPNPPDIYRLGRPRYERIDGKVRIIATGGKIDGDYRAYGYSWSGTGWVLETKDLYPVDIRPGSTPFSLKQSAYPAYLRHPDGTNWVFLNGDEMGREGVLGFAWGNDDNIGS